MDKNYANQFLNPQNTRRNKGGFSGLALTATLNGSIDIAIDCRCMDFIIPDKSKFEPL